MPETQIDVTLSSYDRVMVGLMIHLLDRADSLGLNAVDDLAEIVDGLKRQMEAMSVDFSGDRYGEQDEDAAQLQCKQAQVLFAQSQTTRNILGNFLYDEKLDDFKAVLYDAEGVNGKEKDRGLLAQIHRLEDFSICVQRVKRQVVDRGISQNDWEHLQPPFNIDEHFRNSHRTYRWLEHYVRETKAQRQKLAKICEEIIWLLEGEPELDQKQKLSESDMPKNVNNKEPWLYNLQRQCRANAQSEIEYHSLLEHVPYRLRELISMDDPTSPDTNEYDKLQVRYEGRVFYGPIEILNYICCRIEEINNFRRELALLLPGIPVYFVVPSWEQMQSTASISINELNGEIGVMPPKKLEVPDWNSEKGKIREKLDEGEFDDALKYVNGVISQFEAGICQTQKILNLGGTFLGLSGLFRQIARSKEEQWSDDLRATYILSAEIHEKKDRWDPAWVDFTGKKEIYQSGWLSQAWNWLSGGIRITKADVKRSYDDCYEICPKHKNLLEFGRQLGFERDKEA